MFDCIVGSISSYICYESFCSLCKIASDYSIDKSPDNDSGNSAECSYYGPYFGAAYGTSVCAQSRNAFFDMYLKRNPQGVLDHYWRQRRMMRSAVRWRVAVYTTEGTRGMSIGQGLQLRAPCES